jgi:hypothetical protein
MTLVIFKDLLIHFPINYFFFQFYLFNYDLKLNLRYSFIILTIIYE